MFYKMTYSELFRKSPGNPLEMGSLCLKGETVLERIPILASKIS